MDELSKNRTKKRYGLCLIAVLLWGTLPVWGGDSSNYYAQLTATPTPTGAGKVYVANTNTKPSSPTAQAKSTATTNSGGNVSLYIWTDSNYGYDLTAQWTGAYTGTTVSNGAATAVTLNASTSADGTQAYTATATFTPLSIQAGAPVCTTPWAMTWQNKVSPFTLTFPNIQNAQTVGAPNATAAVSIVSHNLSDLVQNADKTVTLNADIDLTQCTHGVAQTVLLPLTGFPNTAGNQENKTLTATFTPDLTPVFEIPVQYNFGEKELNQSATHTLSPTASAFPNPHEHLNWSAVLSGEGKTAYSVTVANNGTTTIAFTPTQGLTYTATLTLTASWTDASGATIPYAQTLTLSGSGLDLNREGEIHLLLSGVDKTGSTIGTSFANGGAYAQVLDIATYGMNALTLSQTGADQIEGELSADGTQLRLSGSVNQAGEYTKTFTLSGTSFTGSMGTKTATLTVCLKNWWNDIAFQSAQQNKGVLLTWENALYATSYALYKDGTLLATLGAGATSYLDLTQSTAATTYRLVVTNGDGHQYAYSLQAPSFFMTMGDRFGCQDLPDSARSVLFNEQCEPYFDSLYVVYPVSIPNVYCRFYHSYFEDYKYVTADMKNYGAVSGKDTVRHTYTYTNSKGKTFTSSWQPAYTGRVPSVADSHSYFVEGGTNQRGSVGDFQNLCVYSTSSDGFLRSNRRTESRPRYYGYHTLKVYHTYSMTATVRQYVTRSGSAGAYKYGKGDVEFQSFGNLTLDSCYLYSSLSGSTGAAYQAQQKPKNTQQWRTAYPSGQVPFSEADITWWQNTMRNTPQKSSATAKDLTKPADAANLTYQILQLPQATYTETTYNANANHYIEQTWTLTWKQLDYVYVWAACMTDADGTKHLDNKRLLSDGTWRTYVANDTILFDPLTQSFDHFVPTAEQISIVQNQTVFDTIAQVRSLFYTVSQNALNTLPFRIQPTNMPHYFDTTWYSLDPVFNKTGKRTTSSIDEIDPDHTLYYHEFDTAYLHTGVITMIRDTRTNSNHFFTYADGHTGYNAYLLNNVTYAPTRVFAHRGNQYEFVRTIDNNAQRVGAIRNKKIYITGQNDNLFWNSGDCRGWLQPMDGTEVYLDNVRLKTAKNLPRYSNGTPNIETVFTETIDVMAGGEYHLEAQNKRLPALFYLKQGDASFHFRGKNYLSGNYTMATFKLVASVELAGTHNYNVYNDRPVFGAPIAIQDSSLYGNSVPNITCTLDATWANRQLTDGYLDLSVPPVQYGDQPNANSTTIYNPESDVNQNTIFSRRWVHYIGQRYESPLVTGGNHGKFVINGGQLNLWPANGATANVGLSVWRSKKVIITIDVTVYADGGHCANYMAVGNSNWDLQLQKSLFEGSSSNVLSQLDNLSGSATWYNTGDGYPKGALEVNGGTISAVTDTNSYAYTYLSGENTYAHAQNADQTGQPLFVPTDFKVTGGTFWQPMYGTTMAGHLCGNGFTKTGDGLNPNATWQTGFSDYVAADYKAQNKQNEGVSRTTRLMDQSLTDYSRFRFPKDSLENQPFAPKGTALVHQGQNKEYGYGMQNVWSDPQSNLYPYLPQNENLTLAQNYWVKTDSVLSRFPEQALPYHMIVDEHAQITILERFAPIGTIRYRTHFPEDVYQMLTMPFDVDTFFVTDEQDPYFRFYSFVETADNTNTAERVQINENAYCYLYFLDDPTLHTETTHGFNNEFRANYHTHPSGSRMDKGKTYVIKFPKVDDNQYWTRNWVTLKSQRGATVNGAEDYELPTRPVVEQDFLMDGNPTFDRQTNLLAGEYYVEDYDQYHDDNFHATTLSELQPLQGYLLGETGTMNTYRVISMSGHATAETGLENLTAQNEVWGAKQQVVFRPTTGGTAYLYAPDGRLCATVEVPSGALTTYPALAGLYMVRLNEKVYKVWVQE